MLWLMSKFWWLVVITIDVVLTNIHYLWEGSGNEAQWKAWDMSMAGRVCLIPVVMLLQQKLDKWGELAVANYFTFSMLDFIQTSMENNHGFFIEELVAFLLLNFVMIHKWKSQD